MNLCIAIEKFDPHVGGAERYCWDLAHYLAENGHRVEVICIKSATPEHSSIRISQVVVPRFPQALRHLCFGLVHYLKARSLPDSIHFCVGNTFYMDIYQPHGGLHKAWFIRETQRFKPPLREIIRFLNRLSLKDIVQRSMEWWIYRITRPQVIAISEMVAEDILSFFGYDKNKIDLVPNGIDLDRFSPENIKYKKDIRHRYEIGDDDFVFLFVAQNLSLKGFDILIKACSLITKIPFRVLIIGPAGSNEKKRAMHLGDKIIFGGVATDLEQIYPACNCLVHPTYYDACSLVVLESLASGVPVITSSANGASMYVTKENGCIIPPGDVKSLTGAMRDFLLNKRQNTFKINFQDHKGVFAQLERVMADHAKE